MRERGVRDLSRRPRPISTSKKLALFGIVLATPARAIADEARGATASLEWTRAKDSETCIDAAALERSVEELLERRVFVSKDQSDLVFEGSIGRNSASNGFTAKLTIKTPDGQPIGVRELRTTASNCAALDGPLPLVLAMMVEERKNVTLRLPNLPVALVPPPPPPPLAPAPPAPSQPAPPLAPKPWGFVSTTAVVFAFGLLPDFDVGSRTSVLAEPPHFPPIGIGVSFWPTVKYETASPGGLFSAWQVGISICPPISANRALRAAASVGLDGGAITGVGLGLPVTHQQVRPYFDAELLGVLTIRLVGPLGLDLAAGGAVPFTRTNFSYTTRDGIERTIFQVGPVIPICGIGLRLGLSQ